jgi:hypothetical protein
MFNQQQPQQQQQQPQQQQQQQPQQQQPQQQPFHMFTQQHHDDMCQPLPILKQQQRNIIHQ